MAGSASCQYAGLNSYNSGYAFGFTPSPKQLSGTYIVPNYPPINHNSLTMSASCAGYPSILNAYGQNAGNCQTQYGTVPCNSKM